MKSIFLVCLFIVPILACTPPSVVIQSGEDLIPFVSGTRFSLEFWLGEGQVVLSGTKFNVTKTGAWANGVFIPFTIVPTNYLYLSFNRFTWVISNQTHTSSPAVSIAPFSIPSLAFGPALEQVSISSSPPPASRACGYPVVIEEISPGVREIGFPEEEWDEPTFSLSNGTLRTRQVSAICQRGERENVTFETRGEPLTPITLVLCSSLRPKENITIGYFRDPGEHCFNASFFNEDEGKEMILLSGNVTSFQTEFPYETCFYRWGPPREVYLLFAENVTGYQSQIELLLGTELPPFQVYAQSYELLGPYRYRVISVTGNATAGGEAVVADRVLFPGTRIDFQLPGTVWMRYESCTVFPETFQDEESFVRFNEATVRISNLKVTSQTLYEVGDFIVLEGTDYWEGELLTSAGVFISPFCSERVCEAIRYKGTGFREVLDSTNLSISTFLAGDGIRLGLNSSYFYSFFEETRKRPSAIEQSNEAALVIWVMALSFIGITTLLWFIYAFKQRR